MSEIDMTENACAELQRLLDIEDKAVRFHEHNMEVLGEEWYQTRIKLEKLRKQEGLVTSERQLEMSV